MALAPGTFFGRYQIQSLLGAGGMGEVYRAQDTKLRRIVAIKFLPQQFVTDKERCGGSKRKLVQRRP
jgi:eukaryotic-like serine/threonine-protein kinase